MRLSDWVWMLFFTLAYPEEIRVTEEQKALPRLSRVCSRDDPEGGCPERMESVTAGKFWPDYELWGWVWKDAPLRKMTERTKYYVYSEREDDNHPDNSGHRFIWNECPWCRMELPSMGSVRKHQEKLAYEQGDGGQ